jgi:hypothetical protein
VLNIAVTLMRSFNLSESEALTDAEVTAIRLETQPGEQVQAYLRGWLTGEGSTLWLVTSQRVLLINMTARERTHRLAFSDIESLDHESGRYGTVVRLRAAGRHWAVLGSHRLLVAGWVAALGLRTPEARLVPLPLDAAEASTLAGLHVLARLRVEPASGAGTTSRAAMLVEADRLHTRGALSDAEYRRLKGQLLEAA